MNVSESFNLDHRSFFFLRVCLAGTDFPIQFIPLVSMKEPSFDEHVLEFFDMESIIVTWSNSVDGEHDFKASQRNAAARFFSRWSTDQCVPLSWLRLGGT